LRFNKNTKAKLDAQRMENELVRKRLEKLLG
jgi:hypothetical protein